MTDESSSAVAAPPSPSRQDDRGQDSDAMFFVSLAAGVLGLMALVVGGMMWVAMHQASAAGTTIDFFKHAHIVVAAGFGLIVLGVGLQIEKIIAILRERRSLIAINVIVMTVLALALTVLVNWVSNRHYREFDWTRQGVYSISDESKQIVAHLDRPIRIFVIQSQLEELDLIRRLIDHYRAAGSGKLEVEYIDPATDEMAPIKLKKLGVDQNDRRDLMSVIVQSGSHDEGGEWKVEKSKRVAMHEMFGFESSGGEHESNRVFKGESVLTGAILEVTEGTKAKIYFTTGHGESSLEGRGPQANEIGEASKMLRSKNYEVATLDFAKRERHDIPEDAAVIAIVGPSRPFAPEEVATIETYLKGGGKLLALLSPIINVDDTDPANPKASLGETGLEGMLRKYNVDLDTHLIAGLKRVGPVIMQTFECVLEGFDAQSKITEPFSKAEYRAIMLQARAVKALSEGKPQAREILKTADVYSALTLDEVIKFQDDPNVIRDKEHKAWPVMVQVEEKLETQTLKPGEVSKAKEKATRIVVAGDSSWVSNRAIRNLSYVNEPLFMNSLSFLTGQQRFSREAVRESSYRLDMGQEAVIAYSIFAFPVLPFFAVLVGLVVWIVRRR